MTESPAAKAAVEIVEKLLEADRKHSRFQLGVHDPDFQTSSQIIEKAIQRVIDESEGHANEWKEECGKRDKQIDRLEREQKEIARILRCDDAEEKIYTPSNLPNIIRDQKVEIRHLEESLQEAKLRCLDVRDVVNKYHRSKLQNDLDELDLLMNRINQPVLCGKGNLRLTATNEQIERLKKLLIRSRSFVEQDSLMMGDISRHQPLSPEAQAKHDATEWASDVLLKDLDDAGIKTEELDD